MIFETDSEIQKSKYLEKGVRQLEEERANIKDLLSAVEMETLERTYEFLRGKR